MKVNEIMKYIESEYSVINETPCDICGGEFFADNLNIEIKDGIPYDVCQCVCSNCGYEKTFEFTAPFIDEKAHKKIIKKLN